MATAQEGNQLSRAGWAGAEAETLRSRTRTVFRFKLRDVYHIHILSFILISFGTSGWSQTCQCLSVSLPAPARYLVGLPGALAAPHLVAGRL